MRSAARQRWASAAVVAVALAAGGCGSDAASLDQPAQSAPAPSAPTQSVSPGPTYLGPVATGYTVDHRQVHVESPRSGDVAGVGWATAYDVACAAADAPGVCAGLFASTATLARVSAATPADLGADGTTRPLLDDRLVYVMTSTTVCAPSGPAGASAGTPGSCVATDFLDADTGRFLFGLATSS